MTTVATPEVETISINDIKNNTPQSNKSTSVPNENPSTQMADIMKTSVDDKQTNELEKNQNQTQEIKTLESTEIANAPSQESCDFQSDTSLIRKQYIYKDNARIERTGRKIQFVDEVSVVFKIYIVDVIYQSGFNFSFYNFHTNLYSVFIFIDCRNRTFDNHKIF